MQLRVLQAVKRLAEAQVAKYIKSGVVEPMHDINDSTRRGPLAGRGLLAQPLDQDANPLLQDGLLLRECTLCKGGRNEAARAAVRLRRRVADNGLVLAAGLRLPHAPVARELHVVRASRRQRVVPGLRLGAGQLVGRDAHERAVPLVDRVGVEHDGALGKGVKVGEAAGGP